MTTLQRQIWKVLADPLLAAYLLNAQLQMAWRADVPLSVRLRGKIRMTGPGHVRFGEGVMLLGTVVPIEIISLAGAKISIGSQTFINYGCSLSAHQEIVIGARCKIGHYVFVMDNNQHDTADRTRTPPSSPVTIEDNVWIGAHAIILPGVRIGRNSVVGAGSVVTRDVPPDCIVAGNPAKVVRTIPSDRAGAADATPG
jgi:serine acetyltransferase